MGEPPGFENAAGAAGTASTLRERERRAGLGFAARHDLDQRELSGRPVDS